VIDKDALIVCEHQVYPCHIITGAGMGLADPAHSAVGPQVGLVVSQNDAVDPMTCPTQQGCLQFRKRHRLLFGFELEGAGWELVAESKTARPAMGNSLKKGALECLLQSLFICPWNCH
jgi:hypothetical protein